MTRTGRMRIPLALAFSFAPALATFPRPLKLPQSAAQRLDFLLVGSLLPLSQLHCLQHFLHLIHRITQGFDNLGYLFDRPLDTSL